MTNVLDLITGGKPLPEVQFNVTVDDKSIAKIGVAAVIVVVLCLLIARLLKTKK